jgi:ketosteroid isomerase-like protein
MKTYLAHAAAVLLVTAGLHAQAGGAKTGSPTARQDLLGLINQLVTTHSSGSDELLKRLDRACVEAMVQSDVEALSVIEAEDFTFISPDGSIMTKAQDLATIRSGDIKYESVELQEQSVRMFGDAGVVTGRANVKGRYRTFDISGAYRYTVTFARRDQRWQAVASQMTRIEAGGPPATGIPR